MQSKRYVYAYAHEGKGFSPPPARSSPSGGFALGKRLANALWSARFGAGQVRMMRMVCFLLGVCLLASAQTGCINRSTGAGLMPTGDPLQKFNRKMFAVTQGADKYALKPAAKTYRALVPSFARRRVQSFSSHLGFPTDFTNNVLQGKLGGAGQTLVRFVINSTLGIGGLFDPATALGLKRQREDFGQTFAVWGIRSGPYVYVPLLGPTSPRTIAGRAADTLANPLTWVNPVPGNLETYRAVRGATTAGTVLGIRADTIELTDALEQSSPDYYISQRSLWIQRRRAAILDEAGGPPPGFGRPGRSGRPPALPDLPDLDELGEPPDDAPSQTQPPNPPSS